MAVIRPKPPRTLVMVYALQKAIKCWCGTTFYMRDSMDSHYIIQQLVDLTLTYSDVD
jgi:hypothetical protein